MLFTIACGPVVVAVYSVVVEHRVIVATVVLVVTVVAGFGVTPSVFVGPLAQITMEVTQFGIVVVGQAVDFVVHFTFIRILIEVTFEMVVALIRIRVIALLIGAFKLLIRDEPVAGSNLVT